MKVCELIEVLRQMPQELEVFYVNEYDSYFPVKHANEVKNDNYDSGPHVQLSEYGLITEEE